MKTQTIKNKTEFDNAIATYCLLASKVERLKTQKAEATEQQKDAEAEMEQLRLAAKAYALAHEAEVLEAGKKSGSNTAAAYGFKKGKASLVYVAGKAAELIEKLLGLGRWGKKFLKVKYEPDKEALKTLGEQKMSELGLAIKPAEDDFYITPKK